MKAVVLEIKKNKAITLSEDGTFTEIRDHGYKIGQSIIMEGNVMKKMGKKYRNIGAGIAASLIILLGGGTAYAYNTPVAHVSLDVNPSITYLVNSFDRVIGIEKVNGDGELILESIDWDGQKLSKVVEQTILALKAGSYLDEGDWYINSLVVGVNADSSDREEKLIVTIKQELSEIVYAETNKKMEPKELSDVVVGIGAERVADAIALSEKLGFDVTPGKLNLVQKLNASYTELGKAELTTSEAAVWLKGSVKDIMAQVKVNRLENRGITPDAIEPGHQEDAMMGNGNIGNNGNGNAGGTVNDNNGNKNTNKMEKERNDNGNQKNVSPEAIEIEQEEEQD